MEKTVCCEKCCHRYKADIDEVLTACPQCGTRQSTTEARSRERGFAQYRGIFRHGSLDSEVQEDMDKLGFFYRLFRFIFSIFD